MTGFKANLSIVLLAILFAGGVAAVYLTRDATASLPLIKSVNPAAPYQVDESLAQTARQLSTVADFTEEQTLAREAIRLADLETDQEFASVLRQTSTSAQHLHGPLKQLAATIAALKMEIAASPEKIVKLAKAAETDEAADDQLELAKAQLALNQDELADAQQDLARQGGDPQDAVQRAFQDFQAVRRQPPPPPAMPAPTSTMNQEARAWFSLHDRVAKLRVAGKQAAVKASSLEGMHDALEKTVTAKPNAKTSAEVDELLRLSDERKSLTEFDKRIGVSRQLAAVYDRWIPLTQARASAVAHLLSISLAIILAILLVLEIISRFIRAVISRQTDRRRLHQLRALNTIAVQVTGAVVILIVIFGIPTQTSTMIGLATAGLTVALKDFIVAFFGWFALMGRNGIHVGDWVEIEGVGGEVIEIGVMKTVLLEMGNWTSTGHPTGRRVAFMNKFAIENHFFNFSTTGQWLWDELRMTLPATGDPYPMAFQIRDIVEHETTGDAELAQQDWERVTQQYGTRPFSAKPAVDLKPSASGLEVTVRYITRAPQRYEVKSRLFEAIVAIIHKGGAAPQLTAS